MSDQPIPESPDAADLPLPHRVRHRWGRSATRFTVNLTSLIDVTFLLLIYFMVATDLRMSEEIYRLDLPERRQSESGAAQPDPFALDENPLRIALVSPPGAPDQVMIHIEGSYPQPDSFQALHEFLRGARISDQDGSIGSGLFASDHPIIIQPGAQTLWEHAIEAFNAAARARYTNITFDRAS